MSYDPFERGPFPVGVRTATAVDRARGDRLLTVEVWYPAAAEHAGQDLAEGSRDTYDLIPGFPPVRQEALRDAAPRGGKYPLVAFSHGFGGHRRQTTFLCTHLASHGYVVASADHTGNTLFDILQFVMAIQMGGAPPDPDALIRECIKDRPADVTFLIDRMHDGFVPEIAHLIDPERVGMTGHSLGGWTTLAATARDRRIQAALPLAPAGGSSPMPVDSLKGSLDFDWRREVPTLYLVAERDSILPLPGMHELFAQTQPPKRMIVLKNADHMHFCDRVEETHELFRSMAPPGDFERVAKTVPPVTELCPGEHAYLFARALGLAHMDAHLKGDETAARFLAGDVRRALADRGIDAEVV